MIMEGNMIVIRDSKTSCFKFDWPKDVDECLMHEIKFIIKGNEHLADNKIKNEFEQLLFISMNTIFINTENSETNEPHKFVFNVSFDLRSSKKHVALQNLYIYYTLKYNKTRQKNKLKIIAPTWNDQIELPNGSYSVPDIQYYIKYIIRSMKN